MIPDEGSNPNSASLTRFLTLICHAWRFPDPEGAGKGVVVMS